VIAMLTDPHKPALSRPRPEVRSGRAPGGEGGNRSSRLAAMIGSNSLLAVALLLSATLVALTTAVLR
jgi:hypothetical protein